MARTAFYRIMRVAERFPDIDAVVSYYEKFMKLDPEIRMNFLAYERIRSNEEVSLMAASMLKGI